jgi:hypothetical protein
MKKALIIAFIVALLAALGTGAFFLIKKSRQPAEEKSTRQPITEPVNVIAVSKRPYVTLTPKIGGQHPPGKEVVLTIHNTTLGATQAEYELEYQAGSLLQGAFGMIDFATEPPPASKDLLLGTCSAGGACSYNEDVSGGTLLLRFSGGQETFAVKGEWSYSKFRLDVGDKGLSADTYVIIMQPMGFPGQVEGEIVAGPYHIAVAGSASVKPTSLKLRLSQEMTDVTLLGWTGSSWKEYPSELDGQELTATIDRLGTYVVVSAAQAD